MHPAFENAGKKSGLEIWRIENFEPVPWPEKDYGKFYSGDSYIILRTSEKNNALEWTLHFWLGSETSQDEYGAAAMLAVQLDLQLGGDPVEYREVEDYESQLFLSHFKNGIRYMPGGVASAFRHVTSENEKKMYMVKGKKHVRVKRVGLSDKSLNKGDCFILDNGDEIFVYVGVKSKRLERLKAIITANLIRDEDHAGRSKICVIDEYSGGEDVEKFFETLGSGSQETVADEKAGGDDELFEKKEERVVSLHKVSDAEGKLEIKEVAQKPLSRSMLDSNDCFILVTERADLYVWIGKKCSAQEKSEGMRKAQHFLVEKKHPPYTRVRRVVEEGEPAVFQQYFEDWDVVPQPRFHENEILRAYHCKLVSEGKLITAEIYDVEQEDLDEDDVILIDTIKTVFIWFGKDSSPEEREICLQKAKNLKRLSEKKNLVSIEEGQETKEFTQIFKSWDPEFWKSIPNYEERKSSALGV